jgi:hypothetical protein
MLEQDKQFFESLGIEFKGEWGDYKIFSASQGILIANVFETKEKILEFNKMSFEDQKKIVPGLSDDHSGGTWSMTIRFAIDYLPMLLVNKRDKKIDDILN